jgi:hypothetical protein
MFPPPEATARSFSYLYSPNVREEEGICQEKECSKNIVCAQGLQEVRLLSSETLLLWSLRATRSTASLLAAHTPKRAAAVPSGRLSTQEAASEVSNR